ncbi:Pkinase-domain-containing protein [Polychaeton citri CBS 116435]|uniref:Pkinase-domain-containing protein n=1 Tax=Polychaeton citri CBS 116435 TaxID=1314669 RepID=A0A9P4QE13_9PEZI|nr:Pkinase-domain-containing protein [Polychaeton citri CBS 116435]
MENTQLTQPCTQPMVDPRRIGRNNSGLSNVDISDVMCILHPCSPAAFKIVAETADASPQHVLQNAGFHSFDDDLSQTALEEQETFILDTDSGSRALDLALRFSTRTIRPELGFVFGRHRGNCDVVLLTDSGRRISNVHFRIYVNAQGVLMLADMSTNGTLVDDTMLKGRATGHDTTRMLTGGSVIQILSPSSDELIKFIVRIPSREGFEESYNERLLKHLEMSAAHATKERQIPTHGHVAQQATAQKANNRMPLMNNPLGMHWSGGDKYNVVGRIGKGAFAMVYQLATKSDGQLYAAKELEKRRFIKNGVIDRKLDNEMQIMKSVSHPNIVRYIDYHDVQNHLYIIMEFVPCGDLQQYLNLKGCLPESLGKRMAAQVFDALDYLHIKKITHRDIKPDNILLADLHPNSFVIKLSDFGLSKVVTDNETFLKTFCGTLLYCAPEVFPHYDHHMGNKKRPRRESNKQAQKFHSYSQSVDVWSFGAVLWFSLCLKPPFEGVADNTGRGMFEKIMGTPLEHGDLAKQGVSDAAVDLLATMLNTDPASRPSAASCLRHKWFTGRDDLAVAGGAVNLGLLAIAEEDEIVEGYGHPDMSSLSIHESDQQDSQHSHDSEVSIHSGDIAFFDPRQSKRFKSNAFHSQRQDDALRSSQELYHSIPIMHQPDAAMIHEQTPRRVKLFGEISRSALNSSKALIEEVNDTSAATNGSYDGERYGESDIHGSAEYYKDQSGQQESNDGAVASPSLLGAESMVREMNMDSPRDSAQSTRSLGDGTDGPKTPQTSHDDQQGSAAKSTPLSDVTPKPAQQPVFSRQIKIPIPASFYFVPDDPSTHNLEYASKISGRNYLKSGASLPETTAGSTSEHDEQAHLDHDQEQLDTDDLQRSSDRGNHAPLLTPLSSEFLKPPPRLGRLITTMDSSPQMTLTLTGRDTTWGRAPSNDIMYPDGNDTRVARRALIIRFGGKGIDDSHQADNPDWPKQIPDLHTIIATESRLGISVNGIRLKKGEVGRMQYGKIHTGDEVEVYPGSEGSGGVIQSGAERIAFRVEIYHGEGRLPRLEGNKFKVEVEGSSGSGGKGKEKASG